MSKKVKIVEVGPRDGLQNEMKTLSVTDRVEFIQRLVKSGLKFVEGGSFVSPKAIPQMMDSEGVWEGIKNLKEDFSFLVPNERGLERAIFAKVKSISVFTATSNEFNQKNIGMSVKESLTVIKDLVPKAKEKLKKVRIRGYISTAFGCPYEGPQKPHATVKILNDLFRMGCDEVSIGDTIGVAHPEDVKKMIGLLRRNKHFKKIALHFHDTRGMALVNIKTALDLGIRIFDSAIGGLGGCPYATGSSGNVATEEVIWLLKGYGFSTGVSLEDLLETSKWIETKIERRLRSKLYLSQPKRLFYGGRGRES
ncbi:MAG: Hydroxymethylglutaryl-CoA lyase [Bacteriovoracaceae bacterium]|nr:Hydroxymethylglutaryl-CoA lyase [Bacteriovoracaceae bacterium]